jgi:hypothetical protein
MSALGGKQKLAKRLSWSQVSLGEGVWFDGIGAGQCSDVMGVDYDDFSNRS